MSAYWYFEVGDVVICTDDSHYVDADDPYHGDPDIYLRFELPKLYQVLTVRKAHFKGLKFFELNYNSAPNMHDPYFSPSRFSRVRDESKYWMITTRLKAVGADDKFLWISEPDKLHPTTDLEIYRPKMDTSPGLN